MQQSGFRGVYTNTAPRCHNTRSQGLPLCKILRHDGHTGQEQQAIADADHPPLHEDELPILLTDARQHHAQDDGERADVHERMQVSQIVERARDDADEQRQTPLQRPDPGDVRPRAGRQQAVRAVEALEDPERVEHARRVHEDAERGRDLQPGRKAPVGGWDMVTRSSSSSRSAVLGGFEFQRGFLAAVRRHAHRWFEDQG